MGFTWNYCLLNVFQVLFFYWVVLDFIWKIQQFLLPCSWVVIGRQLVVMLDCVICLVILYRSIILLFLFGNILQIWLDSFSFIVWILPKLIRSSLATAWSVGQWREYKSSNEKFLLLWTLFGYHFGWFWNHFEGPESIIMQQPVGVICIYQIL